MGQSGQEAGDEWDELRRVRMDHRRGRDRRWRPRVVPHVNRRDARRSGRGREAGAGRGHARRTSTSAEGLRQRIAEMESGCEERPHDAGAAVLLADALVASGARDRRWQAVG